MNTKTLPLIVYYIFASLLRISGLNASAIWYDESISLYRCRLPLSQISEQFGEIQGTNLWELILRPFAIGPIWILRLPALILSIASIYLSDRIMVHFNYEHRQRAVSLVALACIPGLIWMAQDARYYAGIAFFYMLALVASLERRPWILAISAAALIMIHPTGGAWAASAMVIAVIDKFPTRKLWPILLVMMIGAYRLITLSDVSDSFWLETVDYKFITAQTVQAIFVNTISGWPVAVFMVVLAVMIVFAMANMKTHRVRVVLMAVMLPIMAMLAASILIKPVIFYRTIQPVLPVLCLLAGLTIAPGKKLISWMIPSLACIVLMISLANWDPSRRGGDLDQAAEMIRSQWQDGDVILYGSGTVAMPFSYYIPDLESYIITQETNINTTPIGIPIGMIDPAELSDHERVWVVYPLEPLLDDDVLSELIQYSRSGELLQTIRMMQVAPIEIWLVE